MATTSDTPGWLCSASSISAGEMISPPRLITSLLRPVTYRYPSASIHPMSPVLNHPPGKNAPAVASGSFSYPRHDFAPHDDVRHPTVAHARSPASSTMATSGQMACPTNPRVRARTRGRARDRHALGHAVRGQDRRPGEDVSKLNRHRGEQGPRGVGDEPHRRPRRRRSRPSPARSSRPAGASWGRRSTTCIASPRDAPEIAHVEEGHRHRRAAREERGQQVATDPAHVEQGHEVQTHVRGAQTRARRDRARAQDELVRPDRDDLLLARGPGGVQHQRGSRRARVALGVLGKTPRVPPRRRRSRRRGLSGGSPARGCRSRRGTAAATPSVRYGSPTR